MTIYNVDYSGPERRVVEVMGVYEYNPGKKYFVKVTN